MYEERRAPVKEGEEYEVAIESVGGKGDGIAKVKGFVLFIPNTKQGDYVKIRITKVLPKVGFGEVLKTLDKPVREKKFITLRPEELREEAAPPSETYEDTEDFGEDSNKE